MKEMIKNKLLTSVRISMLNCVDSLDEDMLKKELKENLQKRFELEDKLKEVRGRLYDLNYKIKEIHNVPFDISEIFEMIEILDKENNNENNNVIQ